MVRIKLHEQAIILRKQGKSYGEIRNELNVSKSTLSDWLKKYPLTPEQIQSLKSKINLRIEKYRNTREEQRQKRYRQIEKEELNKWLPLSEKELYLAGLFLYWGEGGKRLQGSITLNNTDPEVVKFFLYWLIKILKFERKKLRVYVHLYSDMNIDDELNYWSKELNLPRSQFIKPYIKQSKRSDLTQKGFGHGTCGIMTNNIRYKEKIIMGIKALSNYYGTQLSHF